MNDERQAAALIGLVILIGLGGLFLTGGIPGLNVLLETSIGLGDIYVDNYRADIYLNGTLAEQFVYRIEASGKYRMLYRTWKIPLSTQNMSVPYVEPLKISSNSGAIPYFTDYRGSSQILSAKDSRYKSEVQSLAELDEAGGYYPQRFPSGLFQMNYLFRIHPFLECDQELCHWNLRLADEHIPYRQATIYIHDPDNLTVQFFPHPEMDYSRVGDSWVITGSSPKDAVLEVEMLLKPQASKFIQGFPRQVSDIRSKTLSAQGGGFDLLFILRSLVLIIPLLLILIYYRFGKEKSCAVPKFLSTIPSIRKPWLVNMVFKGDAYDFDKDGFYATVLDLYRRDIIKIDTTYGTKIILRPYKDSDIDSYERKVLNFFRANSWKDAFSANGFEEKVKALAKSNDADKLARLHKTMDELMHYIDEKAVQGFVVGMGLRTLGLRISIWQMIVPIIWVVVFLSFILSESKILSNPLATTTMILILQSSLVAFAPSTLFGRWKEDFYKEKARVGCIPSISERLRYDSELFHSGSEHVEGMAGIWYSSWCREKGGGGNGRFEHPDSRGGGNP